MRFKHLTSLVAAATTLLAGVLALPAHAQEKATLKLNLKEGESYPLSMSSKQQITQTVAGNSQQINQTFGFTFTFKADKVEPDGTVHGTYTYDAVRIKSDAPGGATDYDSAKGAEAAAGGGPMGQAFAALVGQKVDVVMTPLGKVKELNGADKVLAAVVKAMDLPAEARGMVEKQMQAQFGPEALKTNFEQLTAVYPAKPVAVGESWDVEQKTTAGMPMTTRTTYTLKALSGGRATLDVKATMKTDADAPADAFPGAKFNLEGTQNGALVLDQATGWVQSGNSKQSMNGNISVDAGGQQLQIPMKIESDTTLGQPTADQAKGAK